MPRFLLAAAKTLAAAGVTIAFAAVIPFANSGTGVAWAASRHMRTAPLPQPRPALLSRPRRGSAPKRLSRRTRMRAPATTPTPTAKPQRHPA